MRIRFAIGAAAMVGVLAGLTLVPALAQLPRIAFLGGASPPERTAQGCPSAGMLGDRSWDAFLEGLRERGHVDGRDVVLECRFSDGSAERAQVLAAELVARRPTVLVAFSTMNVRAAKQATAVVPIVMVGVVDPVGRGLVSSLAHPAGNVTGVAEDAGPQVAGKSLQLLKEAVPSATRVAVLGYRLDPPETVVRGELEGAAQSLGIALRFHLVREAVDLEPAFAAMASERAQALVVLPHPFLYAQAPRIVELATKLRLPGVYPGRAHVVAGGLLGYDVDRPALWQRVGAYVDRILKGAKPGDLPVERVTDYRLMLNPAAAEALGIPVPASVRHRVDELLP